MKIEPTALLDTKEELVWLDACQRLGATLTARQSPALTRYCQLRILADRAMVLAKAGPILQDHSPNPGYAQVRQMAGALLALEQQLGLTATPQRAEVPR
jgi:hypothetical protein